MATGTVWRLSEPAAFARLRTTRFRSRSGPLWVAWVPGDAPVPRVAYAIGKRVGGAVVRNRLRRRLRAVLASVEDLARGDYLFGAAPEAVELSAAELNVLVRRVLAALPSDIEVTAGAPR